MFENMVGKAGFWSTEGAYSEIVLSTRVRLARNMPGMSFPAGMDDGELSMVHTFSRRFARESAFSDCVEFIEVNQLDSDDRRFLRERNLITSEMEDSDRSFIILEKEEKFAILVNEEDHFRIQVIKPGFQILETYRLADRVDEELNKFVSYAFSDDIGFLTSCPSNIGTGLRVSIMVTLPALSIFRGISDVVESVKKQGYLMKGTTGEIGKTVGNIFIISNRVSLGVSEIDLVEEMDEIANMVIDAENRALDNKALDSRKELEDRVWRSFGILKYARRIGFVEAMGCLSDIRLGIVLSIIKEIDLNSLNSLMVNIQTSHLQKMADRKFLNVDECDIFRAEYIRENIQKGL